jgi:hypothetical protein
MKNPSMTERTGTSILVWDCIFLNVHLLSYESARYVYVGSWFDYEIIEYIPYLSRGTFPKSSHRF